jgi:hypothetical protein
MKNLNFIKLFAFLFITSTIFNACTKDSLVDEVTITEEQSLEALLTENGFSDEDIAFFTQIETEAGDVEVSGDVEVASTRSACEFEVCANFQGTGRYRVILPNGTIIFFRLSPLGNTVSFNGSPFVPFAGNQFCSTIDVNMSATANLGFRGTGQVITTAQVLPSGAVNTIFSAGVGTTSLVSVAVDVVLTCPPVPLTCDVEICANFEGTGIYRVILPNGTTLLYRFNQFGYTLSVNGGPASGFIPGNEVCETIQIPFGSSFTAELGFKGPGQVITTADWINSPPCVIFSGGVNQGPTSITQDVTLTCNPVC